MATLNIRIDENLKNKATKTFASMGLDMSSAVKLFLNQSVLEQKIPFEVRTINGFTKTYEDELLKEMNSALKDIKSGKAKMYKDVKEMRKSLGF